MTPQKKKNQSMATAGHHYVPLMHLKRFCNKDGQLEVWNFFEGSSYSTNPKNVAKVHGFYTGDTEASEQDDIIERLLGKLESEAAPVIERVCKTEQIRSERDWSKLCEFLGFLGHRTPLYRQFVDQMSKQSLIAVLSDDAEFRKFREIQLERTGKDLPLTQDEFVAAAKSGGIEIQPHRNQYLQEMIEYGMKACKILYKTTPHIAVSADHLFITSDNPISRWNTKEGRPHSGWEHPHLQINIALSPRVTLILDRARSKSVFEVDGKTIAKLNALTIGTALQYVYSTGKNFSWADSDGIVRWDRALLQEVHGMHKKGQSLISQTSSPPSTP